jgi:dTDP-4-dehydrorhamnose 3,5-epimerase
MNTPQFIEGKSYTDERGTLRFMNELDLSRVKRFYTIQHHSTEVVRAWQGHKIESKWFYVTKGRFRLGIVPIKDWEHPGYETTPQFYELNEYDHQLLYVPKGYANGFQALEPDSILMVFSDHTLDECKDDNIRIDLHTWTF